MAELSANLLQQLMGCPQARADECFPAMVAAMKQFQITTPARITCFLAQAAWESGGLVYFAEIADGTAYEGRVDLGNTQPGDGPRFKGSGPIQVTGRDNFTAAQHALDAAGIKIDILTDPDLARTVQYGFWISCWWWAAHGGNQVAERLPLAYASLCCGRLVNRGNADTSSPANDEQARIDAFTHISSFGALQLGGLVTPRYPGAYWRPSGTNQGSMDEIRGLSLHEAVTRATVPATGTSGIWGWVSQSDACHLYDDNTGALEQYKEFGEIAYGVSSGNSSMLTYESWDNLDPAAGETDPSGRGSNQTSWTPEQCERKADVIAFLHHTAGLEIRFMASSNRAERGVAPHRWGVDPWRAQLDPNGETWTGHPGKSCPGDLRIAQIPGIVARAQVIADAVAAGKCAYLPTGPVDLTAALARTHSAPPVNPGGFLMALTDAEQAEALADLRWLRHQLETGGVAPGQISVGSTIGATLSQSQTNLNVARATKAGQDSLVKIVRTFAGSISALGKGGAK